MSSSKAISLVLHMCSVSYFGTSNLHFMWNTVSFMKFLTLSVDSPQKTLVFHQSSLKLVFHSGLSALGSAFSDTHLHGEHLQGCAQGTVQPGHMWGPPTCLQGQWVMLVAMSPNSVCLFSAQSDSSYLHLSILLHYPLYKLSCKVRGHICSPWENKSEDINCSLEKAFLLFFTITYRMPVKQCPPARITSQRSKSTAVLFSRPPIPHLVLTILSILLKKINIFFSFILQNWVLAAVALNVRGMHKYRELIFLKNIFSLRFFHISAFTFGLKISVIFWLYPFFLTCPILPVINRNRYTIGKPWDEGNKIG